MVKLKMSMTAILTLIGHDYFVGKKLFLILFEIVVVAVVMDASYETVIAVVEIAVIRINVETVVARIEDYLALYLQGYLIVVLTGEMN